MSSRFYISISFQGGALPLQSGAVHPIGEPLYAQVNKQRGMMAGGGGGGGGVANPRLNDVHDPNSPHHQHLGGVDSGQGGDSWV